MTTTKAWDPWTLGSHTVRNRIVFGPHETNLGRGRAISDRHVAYYRRRAAGGAGLIVVEEASAHPSDWPYERAPLASECAPGWAATASACHAEGASVMAAIGHAGGQGASAFSQAPLWAPSRIPEVNTREVPKWMEADDIAAVVAGFADAASVAVTAGMDGVEVNAGQHSLIRQFLSGLTNQRTDDWGEDRSLLARQVLEAVRRAAGPDAVIALRFSADEMAPWAGITPDAAVEIAAGLAPLVQAITVVRGGIYSVAATRPDGHTEPGFNIDLAAAVRAAVPSEVAVIAQGSIVDVDLAAAALADRGLDAVEMTRAQIADPDLANKWARGETARIRPCILCNQTCQVRDNRNPLVSCVMEPSAGHEMEDRPVPTEGPGPPGPPGRPDDGPSVLIVGGGAAGLECARVAALGGHRVTVAERRSRTGGMVRAAAAGGGRQRLAAAVDWLAAECRRLGVTIETGRQVGVSDVHAHDGPVVICTGSRPGWRTYDIAEGAQVATALEVLAGQALGDGPVVIWDPVGGPIAISVAEALRSEDHDVSLISPDTVVGTMLARTGDLAPANTRLQAAGVTLVKRSRLISVQPGSVTVEDQFSAVRRQLDAGILVDAGPRLPDDTLWREAGGSDARLIRAGDAVAPRSIYEAVLEGRRAAQSLPQRRRSASLPKPAGAATNRSDR